MQSLPSTLRIFVQNVLTSIRHDPWIYTLILLGLGLRFWGIGLGLPGADLVGDETFSISYILRILATKNPFIHTVNPYPVMLTFLHAPFVLLHLAVIWLQNGFKGADELQTHLLLNGVNVLLIWPRIISAIFGTATLVLIYKILSRLFARTAAYVGTAAVTVSLLAIHLSHWGRPHALMVFFITAAAYAALLCVLEKAKKYFYATFILAACACATHYLGVASLIFPFMLLWWHRPRPSEFAKASGIFLAIVIPAYAINYSGTLLMVWGTLHNYYIPNNFSGLTPVGPFERFYYVFRDLFYLDPIGVAAGVLGIVLLVIRKKFSRPVLLFLVGTAFLYLVQIAIVAAPRETRWLLPFNIFFIGLGFAALADALNAIKWKSRSILPALLFVLLVPQLAISLKWLSLLDGHTQLQVEKWMQEHRAERVFVYSENINPIPTPEAAAWNAEKSPRLRSSAKNLYVIAHPDRFVSGGLPYFHGTELGEADRCGIFKDLKIRYVIVKYASKSGRASALDGIRACISEGPAFKFNPGPDALLALPYENLVNSILSYRYVLVSTSIGPWYEIYEVNGGG